MAHVEHVDVTSWY